MADDETSALEISWNIGEEPVLKRTRSRSLESESEQLPSVTENGIRLGTPVAREAARSFWSMDMFKTSLNRMAFYADCENHSQGSLGTPDSGFQSRVSSARSTPKLPLIVSTSAPSSPLTIRKYAHDDDEDVGLFLGTPVLQPVDESPLLIARKKRETDAAAEPSTSTLLSSSTISATVSPSSSSNTISQSSSSQILASRRHMKLGRSRSAEPSRQLLLPQRKMQGARSETSIYLRRNHSVPKIRPKTLLISCH